MKRFVSSDLGLGIVLGIATVALVAATEASAGAMYLIAFGFIAGAILWQRFHEPSEESLRASDQADQGRREAR